jgi:UDP-2,3-diacylglucosamine pyrophosphatase LpxH
MRRLFQKILLRPVLWATRKFSSRPDKQRIKEALDKLYENSMSPEGKKGLTLSFEHQEGKFIIFSDQHKGSKNGADDFAMAEHNYLAALNYYYEKDFFLVCLGDSEELWENSLGKIKEYYAFTFEAEKKFCLRQKFVKIIGNHDLYWGNDPFAWMQLEKIYSKDVKVYEALLLIAGINGKSLRIFCTHGHQGDAQSDGNWFSKFFVARIWAPLQAYLRINPNTPAYNNEKKTLHNEIMYDWSSRQVNTLLITGHTHQPVFQSLTHIERLYKNYLVAKSKKDDRLESEIADEIRKIERFFTAVSVDYLQLRPSYFNSGCCCFSDGDITGIEIEDGFLRLIKWTGTDSSRREILEEISLEELMKAL